jgi:hypothetical protein
MKLLQQDRKNSATFSLIVWTETADYCCQHIAAWTDAVIHLTSVNLCYKRERNSVSQNAAAELKGANNQSPYGSIIYCWLVTNILFTYVYIFINFSTLLRVAERRDQWKTVWWCICLDTPTTHWPGYGHMMTIFSLCKKMPFEELYLILYTM